ncbi:MAG: hypothetical protein WDM89_11745 [Rhizomicrobium sp.]
MRIDAGPVRILERLSRGQNGGIDILLGPFGGMTDDFLPSPD